MANLVCGSFLYVSMGKKRLSRIVTMAKIDILGASCKTLKSRGNRHSGQAKRDPESRIFQQFWIPAFAGMTDEVTFARASWVTF